jgi:hypothetical protein
VQEPGSRDVLESCPVAEEADWLRHAAGFVAAFVTPAKRERWADLLTRRPRRILRESHKLHADLDRRYCHTVDRLPPSVRGSGLFYEFFDVPRVVPVEAVEASAGAGDAIYSIVPGELAVYFFHEGEVWLCRSGG